MPLQIVEFLLSPFMQSVYSNLIATGVGAFLGFIAAEKLSDRQSRKTQTEETNKILDLLYTELRSNQDTLHLWKSLGEKLFLKSPLGLQLADEVWQAFSDGGELEWIKDPGLVFTLARAYGKVKTVRYFAERLLEMLIDHEFQTDYIPSGLIQTVHEHLDGAVTEVDTAMGVVYEILSKLDPDQLHLNKPLRQTYSMEEILKVKSELERRSPPPIDPSS